MREVPLATPGEILALEWLEPLQISQYALAKAIAVPPRRINEIIKGQRAITADTAVRLGVFFGVAPQSWMNLQTHYDTELAREKIGAGVLAGIREHAVPNVALRRNQQRLQTLSDGI
jgi:addiction module HigA family antidote